MSSSSNKTNRNSKEDSDVLSKAVILEDNDNKLSIINKIQAHKEQLSNNEIESVPKKQVISFVECIQQYIQQSHNVTMASKNQTKCNCLFD